MRYPGRIPSLTGAHFIDNSLELILCGVHSAHTFLMKSREVGVQYVNPHRAI